MKFLENIFGREKMRIKKEGKYKVSGKETSKKEERKRNIYMSKKRNMKFPKKKIIDVFLSFFYNCK